MEQITAVNTRAATLETAPKYLKVVAAVHLNGCFFFSFSAKINEKNVQQPRGLIFCIRSVLPKSTVNICPFIVEGEIGCPGDGGCGEGRANECLLCFSLQC